MAFIFYKRILKNFGSPLTDYQDATEKSGVGYR